MDIVRNPKDTLDQLDGRDASYKAGCGSPAVYYWIAKRGDKTQASRLGLPRKHLLRLNGFRVEGGRTMAVCSVNGCWYTVTLR